MIVAAQAPESMTKSRQVLSFRRLRQGVESSDDVSSGTDEDGGNDKKACDEDAVL